MASRDNNSHDHTANQSSLEDEETQPSLSQMVNAEHSQEDQQATNQQINETILYQPDRHLEEIITARFWFRYILLCLGARQFCQLLAFITSCIIVCHRALIRQMNGLGIQSHYIMNADRDATDEGRLAHPSDEDLPFSSNIRVVNTELLNMGNVVTNRGDTQNDAYNAPHMNDIVNNENGNNVDLPVHAELNNLITTPEFRAAETVADTPYCNVNSLNSVQSHDNIVSNESSDEDLDNVVSSESGFEGDVDTDSSDDQQYLSDQMTRASDDSSTNAQNDASMSRADTVVIETVSIPPTDVREITENIDSPLEGAEKMIAHFNQPLLSPTPKLSAHIDSSDGVSEENVI